MAIMGGWEIFTRNGEGARNEGVGFIMGDGKILKSLYIVGRGVLTPLFYEDLLYCLFRLFQMLKKKISCHLQPPPSLFFLLPCFFSWMGDNTTFDVLFYLMIISIYTCQALVSLYQKDLDVGFVQKASSLLSSDTYNLGQIHLISHTQTHKHAQHTLGPVDWHTHIDI